MVTSPDYIMDTLRPQLIEKGYRDDLTREEYKRLGHALSYKFGPMPLFPELLQYNTEKGR